MCEATDLRHAPLEPTGVALVEAVAPDGKQLLVKVYGRDAWDGQFLASLWGSLWNRGERPSLGFSRLRQVEHEAFVTLLAERGGVSVLPIVAAGMATQRDAVLVTESTGRGFGSLGQHEVGDELVEGIWRAVLALHELGVAHGQLDGDRLVIRPDGSAAIGDFGGARVAASGGAMMADRAQVLVTTALVVGTDRAVAAATSVLGNDALANVLPYLQPAVLDRDTRRSVRDRDWDLDDLMQRATEVTGTEAPELEQLRRVSGKSIAIVALVAFLAYGLISALAGIGIETLWNELKSADMAWIVTALLLAPLSQIPQAFSTMGASVRDLLFAPVLMLQYAVQFIQLAVPSSAARVALEVRFFQRQGVETGGALSIGLIDSVSGFVIQIMLILIITLSGLASLDLSTGSSSSSSSDSSSSGPSLLLLAAGLIVLGAVIAWAIPRYRNKIKEAIPRYRVAIRAQMASGAQALRVLRSPSKVTMLFLGNLTAQLMLAMILGICLRAFGERASFAGLVLVNTFVALFAGFMPVPGGMGVSEAALTAGLVALGVPQRRGDVDRDRLSPGDVLPAADLGIGRDPLAQAALSICDRSGAPRACCKVSILVGCRQQPTTAGRANTRGLSMGMRRRSRRRGMMVGAAVGHHMAKKSAQGQQAPADDYQEESGRPAQYAPPPADPADQIEHLAQLHASGALTDEEFAAAKAKALGT